MWTETQVLREDLERICAAEYVPWDMLRGKTIFITGATGLIGSTIVNALLYANRQKSLGLQILALVRNERKAYRKFDAQLKSGNDLHFIVGTVENLPTISQPIDYIIHGASQTASRAFAESPVETIRTALVGTENMLKLAQEKQVSKFVYLSSMEVYGQIYEEKLLSEEDVGYLNPLSLRSSYPESKRMCENLCVSYFKQYNVPIVIARLAQTFGVGIEKNDQRVFAQFARCAIKGENIVLATNGESTRMYVYTMDAAAAILVLLLKGCPGQAYNVANKNTYSSIIEMAKMVATHFSHKKSCVQIQTNSSIANKLYPPHTHLKLDVSKIESLGWHATVDLPEMYERMIRGMRF
ncbi:MAG: Epimerase domain-containing protein [Oscillospiraceae bacterium]|jgi:UDP-glucuronate decarboxylase